MDEILGTHRAKQLILTLDGTELGQLILFVRSDCG
jgi:hypothetical protein